MSKFRWRKPATIAGALVLTAALGGVAATNHEVREALGLAQEPGANLPWHPREFAEMAAGENSAEAGEEAFEARASPSSSPRPGPRPASSRRARTATREPAQRAAATTGGTWREVTKSRTTRTTPATATTPPTPPAAPAR